MCSLKSIITEVFENILMRYLMCSPNIIRLVSIIISSIKVPGLSILKSLLRGDFIMIKSAGCLSLTRQAGYFSRTFSALTTLAGRFSTTLFISDPSK